jgi:acetyl-CoA C-acetyltransferase
VDRQCGSGLEAIRVGAALVRAGEADVVLCGGTESASSAPGGRAPFTPAGYADPDMGPAADDLARRLGISRERQDAYAVRSHERAVRTRDAGGFGAEIVPVAGVAADDRPRAGLTPAALARFRPAFGVDGTVTAGNACGINDGAAAVAVVSEAYRAARRLPGLRVLASAVAGVDPALPGLGPVPAVATALKRAVLDLADIGVIEITEAFAAQVLACTDAFGLDPLGEDAERVCPDGGAIALGHPWGASGALLVVRLFARMLPAGGPRYGLAACAIGGGQGIAAVFERVAGHA